MKDDQRDPRTYAIIGAASEVHSQLGGGFLEAVYQETLASELRRRGVSFAREVELPVHDKGERLHTGYRADFVCFGEVLVELKAVSRLGPVEEAQVLNSLHASTYRVGLLLNFGVESLKWHRFALDHH